MTNYNNNKESGKFLFAILLLPMTLSSQVAPLTETVVGQNEVSIIETLVSKLDDTFDSVAPIERDECAEKIDSYFTTKKVPLAGYGKVFSEAARSEGLPSCYLVASIAMIESTGGKFHPEGTFNAWGWGNGNIPFQSYEDAIKKITRHLAGNDEKTDQYYAGKDLIGILNMYNPPTVAPFYVKKVTGVIKAMENQNIDTKLTLNTRVQSKT